MQFGRLYSSTKSRERKIGVIAKRPESKNPTWELKNDLVMAEGFFSCLEEQSGPRTKQQHRVDDPEQSLDPKNTRQHKSIQQ
jgi:hypothetical protein